MPRIAVANPPVAGLCHSVRAAASALGGGSILQQIALVSLINFLAFVIGGFIVGRRSAGRTILEPGISAALAVVALADAATVSVDQGPDGDL